MWTVVGAVIWARRGVISRRSESNLVQVQCYMAFWADVRTCDIGAIASLGSRFWRRDDGIRKFEFKLSVLGQSVVHII